MLLKNRFFWLIMVIMVFLPLVFIGMECLIWKQALTIALAGKWFIFWAVGIRLFTAGITQVFHPDFTRKNIFRLQTNDSKPIIQELGIANICIGLVAMLSIYFDQLRIPAALIGGLFFGLAGLFHVYKRPSGLNEKIALISDVYIFKLMAIFILTFIR